MNKSQLKTMTGEEIRLYIDGVYDGMGIVKKKLKSIGMQYTCPSKAYILKYIFGKAKQPPQAAETKQ